MNAPIPPEEFAALVGASPEQVEQWRREGLLDPQGLGRFDELDLVRWLAIHSHEARGYRSDQLAAAIKAGEVHPFMGEFLFPSGCTLTLEEAAERAGVESEMVRQLRMALGLSGDGGVAETWVAQLEAFKTMQAAGLPWEAVLEGARVYGDALRRLAESEVRLVHVPLHERLSASGMPGDEVLRQLGLIQEAVVPLLHGIVPGVQHQHLLHAGIDAGPAIYRAGDYIGSTVNLASRVTAASSAGEILLTEAVADALSDGEVAEQIGVRMLRGAGRPLRLFRVIRRSERRDPVCNAIVADPPAAQLHQNGEPLWFCSNRGLREMPLAHA